MSTGTLLLLDLLAAALATAAWLGAGISAAAGRTRLAAALAGVAVLASAARGVTVFGLAGAGWWFVQDRLTVGLPLLAAGTGTAIWLAGPGLARTLRGRATRSGAAGESDRQVTGLLTAGYAAAAGLAAPLLAGYPATAATGLLAWAAVIGAALVTWRLVAPGRSRWRPRLTAVTALAAAAGAALWLVPGPAVDQGGGLAAGRSATVSVADLRGPADPAAGGQVRRYQLTARQSAITLASGQRVDAWTFNGQVPGPPITAEQGDLIEVTLHNADIEDGVTLHWHGYDVPAGEDGVPGLTQGPVAPGERFSYRFRAEQSGTYWYHTHHASHRGVRMGLYGSLVVTPREPEPELEPEPAGLDLTVPVHTFGGEVVFGDSDRPVEHRVDPGTPVRLRLINTDDLPHRFTLAGTAYRLVAVDGRELPQPDEISEVTLRLPAGGRYDLAFSMPAAPVALVGGPGLSLLPADAAPGSPPDTTGWPELDLLAYGAAAPLPIDPEGPFDRDFTLVLDRGLALVDSLPRYAHTVNGRGHPSVPPQLVAEADLVRFTVVNRSLETHPWHLHGHSVLVLSRDGQPARSPLWVDTFDVRPGEVWQVAFRAGNPGRWMNHCHNLAHAHQGMMLHLVYDGVSREPHH